MKTLMEYLPDDYGASHEMRTIQEAIQPEVLSIWVERDGLLNQLDPRTATWGLNLWEQAFGIPVDESRPMEYRVSRIISKIRGAGTTTPALIKQVSESFANGQVDVIEHFGEYLVQIKFVGVLGVPPNMDDLSAALSEIMPEHLDWQFLLTFRTHGEVAAYTHGGLAAFTHKTIREDDLT